MNLRKQILQEHSKANVLKVADWVGRDSSRFEQLLELFLSDDYRIVQRTAHIISQVADRHPDLIAPYLGMLVAKMQEPGQPVAVKRNVVRILQFQEIPEALQGPVMNSCFDFLADVKETVAVRVFSMTVLANLVAIYPEIKEELRAIIEEGLEHQPTPGFRARGLKILKNLKALKT